MTGLVHRAGVAALVLAAMALGRVVSDVAAAEPPTDPFVRSGEVGDPVSLEYADVTVTDVRSAAEIDNGLQIVVPVERFLLVDLELRATRETTTFRGIYLVDGQGRSFVTDTRLGCGQDVTPPVGLDWRATYCFEVPRSALAGLDLVVARSDPGTNGAGQRRDEIARIDLGLDEEAAEELWDTEERVVVSQDGPA